MAAPTQLRAVGSSAAPTVQLGAHTYTVVPQRIGRLKKRLNRQLTDITELATSGNIIDLGLEKAHSLLEVFIPDLMPLHEFCGYPSQSAMEDEGAEESDDLGPDFPQIVTAYETVVAVNRFDLFKHLGNLVPIELIKARLSMALVDSMGEPEEAVGATTSSASSSSTPGQESPSMTSGPTSPTSEPSEG